jgi:hypothetical protein
MKLARCVLPLLLSVPALPAIAATVTDFFPPGTKVVFGIRVHNLAISPLVQSFQAQAQAQAAGIAWLKALPLDGFDLLRDVDEVLVASTGKGQNPPSIVVVTGRFDVARLAGGASRYHDVPLLGGKKDTDSVAALLDGATALIGGPTLVRAAIDQRGGKAAIDPALNDRITSLRQRYDIWGVGEQPQGFVAPTPETKGLESIDRFQFGMQLSSGLELGAEIHARSPQDAEKLKASLAMVAAMLKPPQPSASAAKFDLKVEDDALKLSVFIPEEQLRKNIQAETAGFAAAATPDIEPSAPAIAPVATAPPAAPETAADPGLAAPPAAPADPPALPAPPKPVSKSAASQVLDKEGNTVILKLPGKN